MTFKEYANANGHLPLSTIRANWGKIQKALQADLAARHGSSNIAATYKLSGKVNADGYIKIAAVRQVKATAAEIRAQRAKDSDSAARHDSKLAELEAFAMSENREGLDLIALVAAANPAPQETSPVAVS